MCTFIIISRYFGVIIDETFVICSKIDTKDSGRIIAYFDKENIMCVAVSELYLQIDFLCNRMKLILYSFLYTE